MSTSGFHTTGSPTTRLQQLTEIIEGMGEGRLTDDQATAVSTELRAIAKMMEEADPKTEARAQDQKWIDHAHALLAGPLQSLTEPDRVDLALAALRTADDRKQARSQGR